MSVGWDLHFKIISEELVVFYTMKQDVEYSGQY